MATSSVNAIGSPAPVDGALANYLRRKAEPNLYRNYEFVACGTEAEVPSEYGLHMNIPSYDNGVLGQTWADKANSLTPVGATGQELNPLLNPTLNMSTGANGTPDLANFETTNVRTIERKMRYFTTGFAVSKMYKSTASVQDEFERIAQFIMKTAAAVQEIITQSNLIYESDNGANWGVIDDPTDVGVVWSGITTEGPDTGATGWGDAAPIYVSPDTGSTNWGSIAATDLVVANKFAKARKYLKQFGNPGFSKFSGKLGALVGPDTTYALTTQVTTAAGNAALTFENESMSETSVFKDNVIGDLFGFRLIETTNPIIIANGTANQPGAVGVDCEVNVLFAPDAFYITPHARLTPQLYVSGFNEGGALNPTKTLSAVATDFLFGAIRGPRYWEKMVLLPTATS